MSARALFLALALAACRDGRLSSEAVDVSAPDAVDFGTAYLGHPRTKTVELTNHGRAPVHVHATASAPFTLDSDVVVPGGASVALPVTFAPASTGPQTATLVLDVEGGSARQVALTGSGATVPPCAAHDECSDAVFDPDQGCVDRPVSGRSCGGRCITAGLCVNGACIGTAVSCDDHDACTVDVCASESGCGHTALQCPKPSDPCRVAACDATSGCGSAPADDGTSCGDNDCTTAHVCIAGACVVRAAPEGSACAPASTCRAASRCVAGACKAQPPEVPQPKWTVTAPSDTFFMTTTTDVHGDVFSLRGESVVFPNDAGVGYPLHLVSYDRSGLQRFDLALPSGLENGQLLLADGNRIYFAARTYHWGTPQTPRLAVAEAHDAVTGALIWSHDLRTGIPLMNSSDGDLYLELQRVIRLSTGDIAFEIVEGESLHQSYLVALSKTDGAELWRVARSGHIYTAGISAIGELWEISAPCWSTDSHLTRVSAAGVEQTRQSFTQPLIGFDARRGAYIEGGVLKWLDESLTSTVVPTPAGHLLDGWSTLVRTVPGQLTVASHDMQRYYVTRYDLDAGVMRWSTPVTALNESVDLRLLRDGGSAVLIGLRDAGSEVVTLADDGSEVERCPFGSQTAVGIANGLYVTTSWSPSRLSGFDLPGRNTETSGWPVSGGLGGAYRP